MTKNKQLILVNLEDKKIGNATKEKVHKDLLLHRAITVFIFNDQNQLLITQRSKKKELWPLFWESSYSTHVFNGDSYEISVIRRAKEELNVNIKEIKLISKFKYTVKYKNKGGENEICALFVGKYNNTIQPNKNEIKKFEWIDLGIIENEVNDHPEKFAPWFKIALSQYVAHNKGKKSAKEDYYLFLSKISKNVDDCLIQYLEKIAYKNFPEKKFLYERILRKKIDKQKLRAMVIYLTFCFFKNKMAQSNIKLVRAMTSFELMNWASYIANWIFDKKAGVTTHQKIKEALITSHAMVEDSLRLASYLGGDYVSIILDYKRDVWRSFMPEMLYLKMSDKKLMNNFELFWESYKNMAYIGVGKIFGLAVKTGYLLSESKDKQTFNKVKNIFEDFGEYLETLNAMQDFVLEDWEKSNEKDAMDIFPDLKIGTPTLPIWIMYNQSSKKEKEFLGSFQFKDKVSKEEAVRVIKLFYETGAYTFCKNLLNQKFRFYKKQIKNIKGNDDLKALFDVTFSIFVTNKFSHFLRMHATKFNTPKEVNFNFKIF